MEFYVDIKTFKTMSFGEDNPDSKYKDMVYPRHFATNHWWTKSDYVKKLQNPIEYEKKFSKFVNRVSWETWISSYDGNFKEVRNDISKVCAKGSVKGKELAELKSYKNVHHLVSTIEGNLRSKKDILNLLIACGPSCTFKKLPIP